MLSVQTNLSQQVENIHSTGTHLTTQEHPFIQASDYLPNLSYHPIAAGWDLGWKAFVHLFTNDPQECQSKLGKLFDYYILGRKPLSLEDTSSQASKKRGIGADIGYAIAESEKYKAIADLHGKYCQTHQTFSEDFAYYHENPKEYSIECTARINYERVMTQEEANKVSAFNCQCLTLCAKDKKIDRYMNAPGSIPSNMTMIIKKFIVDEMPVEIRYINFKGVFSEKFVSEIANNTKDIASYTQCQNEKAGWMRAAVIVCGIGLTALGAISLSIYIDVKCKKKKSLEKPFEVV